MLANKKKSSSIACHNLTENCIIRHGGPCLTRKKEKMVLIDPDASKCFIKCPLLAQLCTPPSCPSTSLCSELHHFLIINRITLEVESPSKRNWLCSHAGRSWLSSSNCRCILSLCTSTISCWRALVWSLSQ